MPEVADIPEVSVQPATEQPQQTIETKTETQPIITKESRMGNRIRDILKRFGGNNPHKTLQEIAGAEEPPAEPSAQEHEQGEDVANTETDPATPVNVEPIPEVFEKSLAGSDFDPKNPTPAAIEKNDTQVESEDEEPTIEELKQMDWWEAQRRIGEVVERRNKKNEVKYRIDSIHHDMFTLGKDRYDVELRSFVEEKVKEGVDWLVENPNRAQEAISYMHDQEDILSHARSLPNKTNTEREYIDMMENNLNKIRIELSNRGISIPDKENDAELSVPEIEDNPPIVVDPETAFEYAYHATPLRNIRSIAEDGLQPSGIDSKEIGTIFLMLMIKLLATYLHLVLYSEFW